MGDEAAIAGRRVAFPSRLIKDAPTRTALRAVQRSPARIGTRFKPEPVRYTPSRVGDNGGMFEGMDSAEFLRFLAAMLAIMNPIGGMPVFISLTSDRSPEDRRRIALVGSLAVLVVLVVTALAGEPILHFFGISVPSFRVAGGIIVLLIALSMLQAKRSEVHHSEEEQAEGAAKESPAVFPLAIPMIAGPGAISTVIIYTHQAHGVTGWAAIAAVIVVMVVAVYVAMRVAVPVAAALGTAGMNVVVRLMGILLAAIAVEMIAGGITGLFPSIGSGR